MYSTILVATQNKAKAGEIHNLLSGIPVTVLTLNDIDPEWDIPEIGTTFAENARIKALAAEKRTGYLTIADDSGLIIDALNGEPGVHSKRFAANDKQCIEKVLELLAGVPEEQRSARFFCAIAIAESTNIAVEFNATVEGKIITAPRGNNGFGYDPIFLPSDFQLTMAELSAETKNNISHRGKAFQQAAVWLRARLSL